MNDDIWLTTAQDLLFFDELTGLYNQLFFRRVFPECAEKAAHTAAPLGLIFLRLEGIAGRGRRAGEALLGSAGQILHACVGAPAFPIHFSGEEFVVLCPGSGIRDCRELARTLVASLGVLGGDVQPSVGISHYPAQTDDAKSLFDRASRACRGLGAPLQDAEAPDLAYNNVAHVGPAMASARMEAWAEASRRVRQRNPDHLDLPYAEGARTKWDLYPAADPHAPCLVYIHGGYWQRGSREAYACMADGVRAHGWAAALPGYTLAPQATLTQIVGELRDAMAWLEGHGPRHGIAGPLVVSGWSAGGHLATFALGAPKVVGGLAISGVFDLAPLRRTHHVNDLLRFTDGEVETLSPLRLQAVDRPLVVAYGTGELPEMIAASRDYHAHRSAHHLPGELIPIPRADHFGILDLLMQADSRLVRALLDLTSCSAPDVLSSGVKDAPTLGKREGSE